MSSNNPTVGLDANSMYICTSQLITPGKFHWSIYLTDSQGRATKYHWALLPDAGSVPGTPVEGLRIHYISTVATYSANFTLNFGFFKVNGYYPIDVNSMKAIVDSAFPEPYRLGFSSVKANRDHKLTCRTWVLSVIEKLKSTGYLQRTETSAWFEAVVIDQSSKLEAMTAQGQLDVSAIIAI